MKFELNKNKQGYEMPLEFYCFDFLHLLALYTLITLFSMTTGWTAFFMLMLAIIILPFTEEARDKRIINAVEEKLKQRH